MRFLTRLSCSWEPKEIKTMDKWMQMISWLVGILGLGGGGVLFYRSKKKSEDAHAREAKVKADLVEVDAYTARIKNLSEEVKSLSDEVSSVRQELLETKGELQKTKEELIAANALIRGLKMNKQEMEEMLTNLKSENVELKRSNSILRMQVGGLKKRNNKAEQE